MYDNELYALTKSQTSPTTRQAHVTNTQPSGTYLPPLSAAQLVMGIGASFVAGTADWMPGHLAKTLAAAYKHKGFSFVHISQRCPHFDPRNFDHKDTNWFSFLTHEKGISPEKRIADKVEVVEHDPGDLDAAFKFASSKHQYFGLFYCNPDKPRYDEILVNQVKSTEQKPRTNLFDRYKI